MNDHRDHTMRSRDRYRGHSVRLSGRDSRDNHPGRVERRRDRTRSPRAHRGSRPGGDYYDGKADRDRHRVLDGSYGVRYSTSRMANRDHETELTVALRRGDRRAECNSRLGNDLDSNPSVLHQRSPSRKRKLAEVDRSASVESRRTLDNPRGARGRDQLPSPTRRDPAPELTNVEPNTEAQGRAMGDYTANHVNLAASGPMCFRISGVPPDWSETDLLGALKTIDPSLTDQMAQLSLHPACCGSTQTALLNLSTCTEYILGLKPNESKYEQFSTTGETEVVLALDRHFYDLTPLNAPGNEIVVDVVAVTGLAGHAFGSWRSRETRHMWLKDFLPQDFKDIRIMSYGYNSNLVEHTVDDGFLDYRRHFIQMLMNARSSAEEISRPIIFIAHSMGGILVLQALLQSKNGGQYQQIFDSTRAIIFFGTPHKGLEVKELLSMVEDVSLGQGASSRSNLVEQLREGSIFLDTHRDDITSLWGSTSDIKIVSFYETKKTATVKKSSAGIWTRGGDQVEMVKKNSAQLYLPCEIRLPVDKNHTEMVKFGSSSDNTYQTVVSHIKQCVGNIVNKKKAIRPNPTKEHLECLKSLNASDYESYRDALLLKRHENTCNWLLVDERYRNWVEKDDQPILWIHGGPGFGKSVLLSVLSKELPRDTKISFGNNYSVAYFFCGDKDEGLRTADAIVVNLLAQLITQNPGIIAHFSAESEYATHKKTSFGMLWRVFERIIKDDNVEPICVMIDALDECDEETRIDLLNRFQHLLKGHSVDKRIKIIITSRPHVPIKSHFPDVVDIPLNTDNLKQDITKFVAAEVRKLPRFPTTLRDEVQDILIRGANGMFLWVSLILDDLQKSTTTKPRIIRDKLKSLPKTLPELYADILRKIKTEDQPIANTILRWVVWAVRPMTLQELTIAIAIRPDDTSISSIQDEMETDLERVLQLVFGPMLKIHADSTVHLVHQSAKDYLSSEIPTESTLHNELRSNFRLLSAESNLELAVSCLTYLSFDEFGNCYNGLKFAKIYQRGETPGWDVWVQADQFLEIMQHRNQFLTYAAIHWRFHVMQIDQKTQKNILWPIFWKVAVFEQKINLMHSILTQPRHHFQQSKWGKSLEIAAYYGFIVFVKELLDIYIWGERYRDDALQSAASQGHEAVVRLLLDRGANVNAISDSSTALRSAATGGHEAVVRLLLDHGADVNAISDSWTALRSAAARGHESVVRLLLDHGAGGVDKALKSAVLWGKEAVVRLLLDHGAGGVDEALESVLPWARASIRLLQDYKRRHTLVNEALAPHSLVDR